MIAKSKQPRSTLNLTKIVLESQYQEVFDSITELAASTLNAPLALITFVDECSIWIHSDTGNTEPKVVENKGTFCGIYPKNESFYEIPNTDLDFNHGNHVLHIKGVKAKYYGAARIKLPLGEMIGVLCIFDIKPRVLAQNESNFLTGLAKVIEKLLITKAFNKRVQ